MDKRANTWVRDLIYAIIVIVLFLFAFKFREKKEPFVEIRRDTVWIRDTIRDTVLIVRERTVIRKDTVRLPWVAQLEATSTDSAEVIIPIEQLIYKTDEYRAVVEGYKAKLSEIEIYKQTAYFNTYTTETKYKKYWLEVGAGIGAGYDPFTNKIYPTIQIGVYIPIFRIK